MGPTEVGLSSAEICSMLELWLPELGQYPGLLPTCLEGQVTTHLQICVRRPGSYSLHCCGPCTHRSCCIPRSQ